MINYILNSIYFRNWHYEKNIILRCIILNENNYFRLYNIYVLQSIIVQCKTVL